MLGACRVQALELQVSLQQLGHTGVAQPSAWQVSASAFWPGGCVSAVSQGWEAGGEQGHVAGVSPRVCSVTEPWERAPGTKAWQGCAQGFSQLQSALGRALGGMGTEGWCPCLHGSKGYVW